MEGYFETFDLTIDDPWHNDVADGLACYNNPPTK